MHVPKGERDALLGWQLRERNREHLTRGKYRVAVALRRRRLSGLGQEGKRNLTLGRASANVARGAR